MLLKLHLPPFSGEGAIYCPRQLRKRDLVAQLGLQALCEEQGEECVCYVNNSELLNSQVSEVDDGAFLWCLHPPSESEQEVWSSCRLPRNQLPRWKKWRASQGLSMKCLKDSLDPRTIASKIRRGLRWDQVSATSRSLPMVLVSYCLMFPNLASSPLVTGRHSPFECQGAIGVPCKTPNRSKGNIQRPMVMLLKDCLLPDGPKFGSNMAWSDRCWPQAAGANSTYTDSHGQRIERTFIHHGTGSQSPMTCGQMRLLMTSLTGSMICIMCGRMSNGGSAVSILPLPGPEYRCCEL